MRNKYKWAVLAVCVLLILLLAGYLLDRWNRSRMETEALRLLETGNSVDARRAAVLFERVLRRDPDSMTCELGLAMAEMASLVATDQPEQILDQGFTRVPPATKVHFERAVELASEEKRAQVLAAIDRYYEDNAYYDASLLDQESSDVDVQILGAGSGTYVRVSITPRRRPSRGPHFYYRFLFPRYVVLRSPDGRTQALLIRDVPRNGIFTWSRPQGIQAAAGTVEFELDTLCITPNLPFPPVSASLNHIQSVYDHFHDRADTRRALLVLCEDFRQRVSSGDTRFGIDVLQLAANALLGQSRKDALQQFLQENQEMMLEELAAALGIEALVYLEEAEVVQALHEAMASAFQEQATQSVALLDEVRAASQGPDAGVSTLFSQVVQLWNTPDAWNVE